MLIKFGLPNGAGGMAAAHGAGHIRKYIRDYEQQCNTTIRTWSFHADHRHWIGAEIPESHESLFALYISDKKLFMPYQSLTDAEVLDYANKH